MNNKVTMPEPVAYPSDDWVEAFFGLPDENGFYVFRGDFGNIADRFRIAAKCAGFITTAQAEAYADARVNEALEAAAQAVLNEITEDSSIYAVATRRNAAREIRALIPQENKHDNQE